MNIKSLPTHLGPLLVTDDFAPKPLQRAMSDLTRQAIWQYGWRSNHRRDRFCYWHVPIAGGDGSSRVNCEAEFAANKPYAAAYAIFKILQQGPLRGHEPLRVYMNAHTFGVEGYVHQDNSDTENYFSTIYYAHPVWHQNWCGETVFYNREENDTLASVFPRPGRAATFHGAVPHCARAPSRDCSELRVVLVFKTQRSAPAQGQSELVQLIQGGP